MAWYLKNQAGKKYCIVGSDNALKKLSSLKGVDSKEKVK